jgi:hypothetical protein
MKAIRKRPRYVDKIHDAHERLVATGRITRPGIFVVDCLHDDWCRLLNGKGECSCDVEIGEFHEQRDAEVA